MKKQSKNEIGITLVALIVTIIILLILAGISITILNHTELLKNVKQAKDTTENAQKEENETLSKYNNKIYEIVNGATGVPSKFFHFIKDFEVLNQISSTLLILWL